MEPMHVEAVLAADRDHVWHPWAVQGTGSPLVLAGGRGATVVAADGREFLDLTSQLVYTNTGHQHPRVVAAIVDQAQRLATASPGWAVAARSEAAAMVAAHCPDGFDHVFFTTGGTEAVENAIRAARAATGRRKVVSLYRSYHGNTAAALAATGDARRFGNEFAADHVRCFGPFLYRSAFWAQSPEEESERALEHLRAVLEHEGPASIAAVLMESVVGASGVIPPPPGYLRGVRQLCDEFGILLILDEVMVGFGRTGSWWAFEQHDVVPDLITMAKGINSGAVPLGAVAFSRAVAEPFLARPFPGGMTYSGHPLACAAAVGAMTAIVEDGLVARAAQLGARLGPALREVAQRHEVVGDVRGVGAFWALELVADRATKEPLAATPLGPALLARGALGLVVGNRLHIAPPLVLTDDECDRAVAVIDDALGVLRR
jgi:taurine--2-oxoglutarate transaminase